MTILRDREHLEYFRNFISSQGETGEGVEAPLQFWLAVEDLKNNIHNSSMYNYKVKKIRERFLDGRPYKRERKYSETSDTGHFERGQTTRRIYTHFIQYHL